MLTGTPSRAFTLSRHGHWLCNRDPSVGLYDCDRDWLCLDRIWQAVSEAARVHSGRLGSAGQHRGIVARPSLNQILVDNDLHN